MRESGCWLLAPALLTMKVRVQWPPANCTLLSTAQHCSDVLTLTLATLSSLAPLLSLSTHFYCFINQHIATSHLNPPFHESRYLILSANMAAIYQNLLNIRIKKLNLFCSRISSRQMFDEFGGVHRDEVTHQNQSNSEILAKFSSKKFHDDKEEHKSEVRLSWWRILERTSHWWFSVGSPQLWSPDSVVGSVQIFPTFQQNTFCFTWELRGELGGGAEEGSWWWDWYRYT